MKRSPRPPRSPKRTTRPQQESADLFELLIHNKRYKPRPPASPRSPTQNTWETPPSGSNSGSRPATGGSQRQVDVLSLAKLLLHDNNVGARLQAYRRTADERKRALHTPGRKKRTPPTGAAIAAPSPRHGHLRPVRNPKSPPEPKGRSGRRGSALSPSRRVSRTQEDWMSPQKEHRAGLLPSLSPAPTLPPRDSKPESIATVEQPIAYEEKRDPSEWTAIDVAQLLKDEGVWDADVEFTFKHITGQMLLNLSRRDLIRKLKGNEKAVDKILVRVKPLSATRQTPVPSWSAEYVQMYLSDIAGNSNVKMSVCMEGITGWELVQMSINEMSRRFGGDSRLATNIFCDLRKLLHFNGNTVYQHWSTEDLRRLLKSIGMKDYCSRFEFVDGKRFYELKKDLLIGWLGSVERYQLVTAKVHQAATGVRNVFDWTRHEVRDFLLENGFGDYVDTFERIDGKLFANMTWEVIKKRMRNDTKKSHDLYNITAELKAGVGNVYKWNHRQVVQFLEDINLAQYVPNFAYATGRCMVEMSEADMMDRLDGSSELARTVMLTLWKCLPPDTPNLYHFIPADVVELVKNLGLGEYREAFMSLNGYNMANITRKQVLERVNERGRAADVLLAKIASLKAGRSNIFDWSMEDVSFLLCKLGLEKYIPQFKGIYGTDLAHMGRTRLKEKVDNCGRDVVVLTDALQDLLAEALSFSEAHRLKAKMVEITARYNDTTLERVSAELETILEDEENLRDSIVTIEEQELKILELEMKQEQLFICHVSLQHEQLAVCEVDERSSRHAIAASEQSMWYNMMQARLEEETELRTAQLLGRVKKERANILPVPKTPKKTAGGNPWEDSNEPELNVKVEGCPFKKERDCPFHKRHWLSHSPVGQPPPKKSDPLKKLLEDAEGCAFL
eukprot:TRINITY_DN63800_c0_g1_i1.p1 TRINITY_DN63800_c0_g1~~TRINITY_DN63800_c0_g1_i1.p1  ORF type:complete len:901 (-),score=86.90 TRINITY_DN63800_c0_g1_i1:1076-3778(-)